MNKYWQFLLYIITLLMVNKPFVIYAQEVFSLNDLLTVGLVESYDSKDIIYKQQLVTIKHRLLDAELGINLNFYGRIPAYTNSIFSTIQNDGNIAFQSINYNNSAVGISLSKTLWQTGGQIQLSSELQRFDNFNTKGSSYNGIPFRFTFRQNLLAYNPFRWRKKDNLIKEQINTLQSKAEKILLKQNITQLYFDIITAQNDISSNQSNVELSLNLLSIANKKDSLGLLSKSDLIQLKLQTQIANSQLNIANSTYTNAISEMKVLLSTNKELKGRFKIPTPIILQVDTSLVKLLLRTNFYGLMEHQRMVMEKEQLIKEKAKQYGASIQLNAAIGIIRSDPEINPIYSDPKRDQAISLTFNVPIWDSKMKRTQIKLAEIELEREINLQQKNKSYIENNLDNIVNSLLACQNRLGYAQNIQNLAIENLTIATEVFRHGSINIYELNIAIKEKDLAINNYMKEVRTYWELFYQLQYWTLYDFINQASIQ